MVDKTKQSGDDLLYELADSLSTLVIREHQILQDELTQLGALVEDAVKELSGGFRELNACVANHTAVVEKSCDHDHKDRLKEMSVDLKSYTSNMNRALQFDDIVQQLANHASDRLTHMQQLFNELQMGIAHTKQIESGSEHVSAEYLQLMLANITKYTKILEKENPVKQGTMSEGGIELF